jgi:predicted ATPase
MRLQQITLQGFQSYSEQQTVEIDQHLTLLAGRNNAGKSALLRAMQTFVEGQQGVHPDFAITYTWSLTAEDIAQRVGDRTPEMLNWMLGGGDPQPLSVTYRAAAANGTVGGGDLQVSKVSVPGLSALASRGIGGSWDNEQLKTNMHEGALNTFIAASDDAARRVLYVAPRRIEQGQRLFQRSTRLQSDGRNLTEVLVYLYLNHRFEAFKEVEELMQDAFPGVQGVVTPSASAPGGSSQLQGEPHIQFQGRPDPIPLRLCGTGLEQMLALAVGVLTAEEPKLVLIDEPQAHLHPHAEHALLGLLTAHPEHQFVVATHSHVLLRSQPLRQARLLSLQNGHTHVAQVRDERQVLGELGISAADLWLVDRLLWVEGATEERVFQLLAAEKLPDAESATLGIRRMPESSRFAGSTREAQAAYDFCSEVAAAIAPLAVEMLFVFDADEKSPEFRERIRKASHDRAEFLPVREMENLFLNPVLLHQGLAQRCELAEITAPTLGAVEARLKELLAERDNTDLYPRGSTDAKDDLAVICGSAVLKSLWWDLATAGYDKVRDGERPARASLETGGHELVPLTKILERVSGRSVHNRT